MTIRVAEEWLHSCSGCEIAILNTGEGLLELLEQIELVHMPLLMDHKLSGQLGDKEQVTLPEVDIGIVSGGVANQEHLEVLAEIRQKSKILIGLGTCASHGGIPAMANQWPMSHCLSTVFSTPSTDNCTVPDQEVPSFLDRVYAVDEKVDVDILIPGCPPAPDIIRQVLTDLVQGKQVKLPSKSVCDTCPTLRQGKGSTNQVQRFLNNADYQPHQPVAEMRCLLEQGLMCMGPVTAAGCAHDSTPRCMAARVPCRGCFGPVRQKGNPMLDMMNALVSNAIDVKSVTDRKSLLRFCGAHGRIRKKQVKR